jgi:hypothetical protein
MGLTSDSIKGKDKEPEKAPAAKGPEASGPDPTVEAEPRVGPSDEQVALRDSFGQLQAVLGQVPLSESAPSPNEAYLDQLDDAVNAVRKASSGFRSASKKKD